METKKSKVFTKKLLAIVLSVVMAVSSFFGVAMSAQAYQKSVNHPYNDSQLAHNLLDWVDATDDQTLEALLDYLDDFLANMDWDGVNETMGNVNIDLSSVKSFLAVGLNLTDFPNISVTARTVGIAKLVNMSVTISGSVDSIDHIIDLMFSVKAALNTIIDKAGSLVSIASINVDTIASLNMDVFGNYFHNTTGSSEGYKNADGSYRELTSAKYIIKGLLKWLLNDNYYNNGSSNILHDALYGTLSLVTRNGEDMVDLYSMLAGTLGMDDWEKSNDKAIYQIGNGLGYNVIKALIVKNVPLYNDGVDRMKTDASWVYDNEAYKIANYYLQKLSFDITYPERVDYGTEQNNYGIKDGDGDVMTGYHNDTSKRRYAQALKAGKFDESTGLIDSAYATAQGWDPNLYYSTESGYEGNVLVTKYNGMTTFSINSADSLHSAFMRAVPIIWKTALKATVQLVHVNFNGHDEHGTNFDNAYYYWVSDNQGWNRNDWTANYTQAKLDAFAAAKYADYGFESVAEFEDYIAYTLTYDDEARAAKNEYYNWRDIDVTVLFNEIRYSPLADLVFNIRTGSLNLYFEQMGCPTVIDFFDNTFDSTGTLIGQIDDVLVAAMADLFPDSQNNTVKGTTYDSSTGTYSVAPLTLPALSTTQSTTVNDVVSTLIADAGLVFRYAADTTNANILNPYYAVNGYQTITEANLEEAIIPFAIAALKQWNITAAIHDSDWDKVCDIESGAVVALNEYLEYIYPDRDYSSLWTLKTQDVMVNGVKVATHKYIVAKENEHLLENAIVPMAGDALLFVVTAAGVPIYEQSTSGNTKTEGYINNTGDATIIDPYNYTFVGKGTGLNSLLWKTINGVVCYFAVDKGIAGLVNLEGQVTKSNTIWQNLDVVLNKFLPALKTLMPRAVDNDSFSSQKIIWYQLVEGAADVANYQFLSTAFGYIGDIFVSTPIKDTTVLNFAIFDVVKPLINLLLGSRTSTAKDIITQTTSTANPVDNFLKRDYLINTAANNLIANLYNVLSSSNSYTTSTYRAICCALNALHILDKLKDNRIGGLKANLSEHAVTSTAVDLKLEVRNASWGFASFYKNASGNTAQRGRYDANISSYQVLNPDGSVNNNFSFSSVGSYNPTGALAAEGFTRVRLTGTATSDTLYTIVVNYTMAVRDINGGSVTRNYSTKAVDFLYVGDTINDSWTTAFSGNGISSTANEALITKNTVGSYEYSSANYIGVGTNAGSADYGYTISNNATTSSTVHNNYASVAANTPNYYNANGSASTAANNNAAYVAVNKAGKIIMADDSLTDADAYVQDDPDGIVMGYISPDNGDTITAVAVDKDEISEFKLGTPIAGVYLDEDDHDIKAAEEVEADEGTEIVARESTIRILSSDSQSGLEASYAPMRVVNSKGYGFVTTIAAGDIDGAYSSYKDHAKGLAVNYITSTDSAAYNTMKQSLATALGATIADGLNASNIARNIDVKDADEALIELAKDNKTTEVNGVINNVIVARRGCTNINYTSPALYEKAVDLAKEAEDLVVADAIMVDDVDDAGQPIKKESRDAEGNINYDYYSYATSVELREAVRSYQTLYAPRAVINAYNDSTTGKQVTSEVTHATSLADDYDETIAATANSYSDFTATVVPNSAHVFEYSTKDGVEKEYDLVDSYNVYVNSANTKVKFGTIDTAANNKLVNTTYTAASWNAYVDALGECLNAITNHATISDCYEARSHLVMAENNLEEGETEGITIKGQVLIATNATATESDYGARDIGFTVGGEPVLDENGDAAVTSSEAGHYGEFEITVPEGTTAITVTGASTVDRTVTLSGTGDINDAEIVIVTCDYAKDGAVNASDLGRFKSGLNTASVPQDLNDDGVVNASDLGRFKKIINKTVSYSNQSLD